MVMLKTRSVTSGTLGALKIDSRQTLSSCSKNHILLTVNDLLTDSSILLFIIDHPDKYERLLNRFFMIRLIYINFRRNQRQKVGDSF